LVTERHTGLVQQPANCFSTPIITINMSHSALNGTLMAVPIKTN